MDFAIPQASRELTSAVRKMVETQLMPHDASIELLREILTGRDDGDSRNGTVWEPHA